MAKNFNLNSYYLTQSDTSNISKNFADKFSNNPNEIIMQVRKRLIHPCECRFNINAENWPETPTAKDIEKTLTKQEFAFGICRAFTLLCVAIMRAKNIPARSRCGFASYFAPGFYEDHWVLEYMQNSQWKLADAQKMKLELKTGEFINGAIAWQLVRKYRFDADLFGFSGNDDFSGKGLYYVIGNMIRDASGLLKSELSYQDPTNLIKKSQNLSKDDLAKLDKISDMILADDIEGLQKMDFAEFM